jgi:hypothetical protein
MKRIYIPLIALGIGFANAFLAFHVHSLLFCLLPLSAFAFGYFSTWKTGLLSGFLLFIGYTTATSLLWGASPADYLLDYLHNFLWGGCLLCVIGTGAPLVKRKLRSLQAAGVLVILVFLVSWCGFLSFPSSSYYYQVIIESSENLSDIKLYLPIGATSEGPYTEIFNHPLRDPRARLTEDYSLELVETEHGMMLKLGIANLEQPWNGPQYPYEGNVIFSMSNAPQENPHFTHTDGAQGSYFRVPLKVVFGQEAWVWVTMWNQTSRGAHINFLVGKGETYTEYFKRYIVASDEWTFADGCADGWSRSASHFRPTYD